MGRIGVVRGGGISLSNCLTAWRNRRGKDDITLIAPTMSRMNDASVVKLIIIDEETLMLVFHTRIIIPLIFWVLINKINKNLYFLLKLK